MQERFKPKNLRPLMGVKDVNLKPSDKLQAEQIGYDVLRQIHPDDRLENIKIDNRSVVWRSIESGLYIKVFTDYIDGNRRYERDLYGSNNNPFTRNNVAASDDHLHVIAFNDLTGGLARIDQLIESSNSEKSLARITRNLGKGLGKIHERVYERYGWLNGETPQVFADYDEKRDFPISSPGGENYYDFEISKMHNLVGLLQKRWPGVNLDVFLPQKEGFNKEILVANNGDYNPWNVFTDPNSAQVAQVIDWEWSSSASRAKDVATSMMWIIMLSRWNPSLKTNLESSVENFMQGYEDSTQLEDIEEFREKLPFFLVSAGLWNAWSYYHLKGDEGPAQASMELVNVFTDIKRFRTDEAIRKICQTSLHSYKED